MSDTLRVGFIENKDPEVEPIPEAPPEPQPPEVPVEEDSLNVDAPAPDEELWPGGPNFAQIEAWKEEHGDVYVTSVTPESHYVWRTLTRFEYRRLVKNLEQQISTGQVTQAEANMNNEEQIAEMCILFPKVTKVDLAGQLAGLASVISQEVMEASGFVALEIRQL